MGKLIKAEDGSRFNADNVFRWIPRKQGEPGQEKFYLDVMLGKDQGFFKVREFKSEEEMERFLDELEG